MRTTITLEEDVAVSLKRLAKQRGMKFKALVNQVLREGIERMTAPAKSVASFGRAQSISAHAARQTWTMLPKFLPPPKLNGLKHHGKRLACSSNAR